MNAKDSSSKVLCPDCGGALSCVDSSGVWWRCYNHGSERSFDMSESAEAQRDAADLRALSASNAAAMRLESARRQQLGCDYHVVDVRGCSRCDSKNGRPLIVPRTSGQKR